MGALTTDKRTVTQDNFLIRASYEMTLIEKRLLILAISKVNPMNMPNKNEPFEFTITAKEWAKMYGSGNAYRDIGRAIDGLDKRKVPLPAEGGATRTEEPWLGKRSYFDKQGKVVVVFNHSVSIYLAGMVDQYTKYDLFNVIDFQTVYAIRLYELLSQYKDTGYYVVSVESLRNTLALQDKYPRFAEFRRNIIEKAVAEINDKSNYSVSWEGVRKGRDTASIKFYFRENPQSKLPFADNN